MQRASEDPAHEAFGRAPERARWSWPHRVFVFALGLLLCFATFTLFVIEKVESYAPRCIPGTPPLARLPAGQLKALRAELSSVMARAGGRVYAAGAVPPDVMWNDEPPERGSLGLGKDGLGRASYEIRRWAPDPRWGNAAQDDIVGDVLEFTSGGRAKRFFAQAAGTRCHRSALARPAPQPDGARNMAWINPDAASEVDVLFIRGRAVYRLADVRPIGSERPRWSVAQLVAVSTLNRLACTASDGACTAQTARFVERASAAVCSLGRELESEYGEEGPWAVFPVRDRTQAILAAVVGQLRRLAPPPSQRADYAAFTDAAARLLAVGRGWNAAQAAGDVGAAAQYLDWAPAYQRSFEAFGNALGIYECAPIEARRARRVPSNPPNARDRVV